MASHARKRSKRGHSRCGGPKCDGRALAQQQLLRLNLLLRLPHLLMQALDAVNARYGRGTLCPLATGIARRCATRHDPLSKRYTTHVEEMLERSNLR